MNFQNLSKNIGKSFSTMRKAIMDSLTKADMFKWTLRVVLFLAVLFLSGSLKQKELRKLDDPYYRVFFVLVVTTLAFYDSISAVLFLLALIIASESLKKFRAMEVVRENMIAGPPVLNESSMAEQIGSDSNSDSKSSGRQVDFVSTQTNSAEELISDELESTDDITVSVGERNSFTSAEQLKAAQSNLFGDSETARQEVRGIHDGFGVQGMTDNGPMGFNIGNEFTLGTERLAML